MKLNLLIYSMILLLLLSGASLYATEYAAGFMEVGMGAEAAGMGMAQVAVANDAYATYWNPAGLMRVKKMDFNAAFTSYFGIVNYKVINYAHVYDHGVLGFSYISSWVDGISNTSYTDGRPLDAGNNFSYTASTLILSKADLLPFSELAPAFWGMSIKFIGEGFSERAGGSGIGVDLGIQHDCPSGFSAGVNIQNIIKTSMAWSTPSKSEDLLPTIIKTGIAYRLNTQWTGLLDVDFKENRAPIAHAGIAYQLDTYTFRGGWDNDHYTMGLGLTYKGFKIDYAYRNTTIDYLDSTHFISIGFED